MMRKTFGRTGVSVSELGMGTYYDPLWTATAFLGWRRGTRRKIDALRSGLQAGMNLIDTAEIYGSEPLVASAIQGNKRDELFIATKVWSNHLHRDDLKKSLERSLRRLGLSYVDLYQIHFPNPRVPMTETMAGMEELIAAGKVVHVGVSNFNVGQIDEANTALPRSQLASVQLSYSLMNRSVEGEVLPYCEKEGLALMAYYPLAHGSLASSSTLDALCRKYGKTPSQVALHWLLKRKLVFPIPRASSTDHVLEDAGASGWAVSDRDAEWLETVFGKQPESAKQKSRSGGRSR